MRSPSPFGLSRLTELAVALAVTALGVYVVWETRDIRVLPVHSRVGPRVIPFLVGAGLIVLGLWLAIEVATGRTAGPEEGEDVDLSLPTDWSCLAILAASLIAYLLLIERAGFVIASAVLFLGAAFGMGSRHLLRDAAVGVLLAAAVYLAFTRGLDLRLPAGWLEGLE